MPLSQLTAVEYAMYYHQSESLSIQVVKTASCQDDTCLIIHPEPSAEGVFDAVADLHTRQSLTAADTIQRGPTSP